MRRRLVHLEYTYGVGVGRSGLPPTHHYYGGPLLYEPLLLAPIHAIDEPLLHVVRPFLVVGFVSVEQWMHTTM